MKRCSTSLILREMQIEIIMLLHFISNRLAKVNKRSLSTNICANVGNQKWISYSLLVGCTLVQNSVYYLINLKIPHCFTLLIAIRRWQGRCQVLRIIIRCFQKSNYSEKEEKMIGVQFLLGELTMVFFESWHFCMG